MKVPLSWLRDWVDWPSEWDANELARRLTFAGMEVEAVTPAAAAFSGVVVAKIVEVEPHPEADKLRVCRATIEPTSALQVVCGAANARAGLVAALATVGARLPNGTSIGAVTIRGIESAGMLCSARELVLSEASEASEGIIELPDDAPVGLDLRRYLELDDTVLDINVTPNRGDAMSILGIAREVAALSGAVLKEPVPHAQPGHEQRRGGASKAQLALTLAPESGAARLAACVLRGADNARATPVWMRERLRRSGVRSISAVVDVTNYVMLELGQPVHAYDLAKLHGGLTARRARLGEPLRLLDGREIKLDGDTLVIADDQQAVGLAGIMGGADSAIERTSRDIALEVAWFKPAVIAQTARRLGISTDASQRFERGVDWCGQERALERAARLIGQITGAAAGPSAVVQLLHELPRTPSVTLRPQQLQRLLGVAVSTSEVERRLRTLGMIVVRESGAWRVQPPSWRFDIGIEADLIEEVGRLGGLDTIAATDAALPIVPRALDSSTVDEQVVMRTLAARGYHEVITYAFIDPVLQSQLFGAQQAIELANPLSSDRAVMRSSLWPGLIGVARENLRRQTDRVRCFEIATRFLLEPIESTALRASADEQRSGAHEQRASADALSASRDARSSRRYREQKMLAGIALGTRLPEQWGSKAEPVDFYDVKGDLASVLALRSGPGRISFEPAAVACLHPGRSARVMHEGESLGFIGELHPGLTQTLELGTAPILFEIDYLNSFHGQPPQFHGISRFPQIRRDISVTVPEAVTFASLAERVSVAASSLLKELRLFDVYQGKGIDSGRKSIAIGLILQDISRTLTDEDADRVIAAVVRDLRATLDAKLRQ